VFGRISFQRCLAQCKTNILVKRCWLRATHLGQKLHYAIRVQVLLYVAPVFCHGLQRYGLVRKVPKAPMCRVFVIQNPTTDRVPGWLCSREYLGVLQVFFVKAVNKLHVSSVNRVEGAKGVAPCLIFSVNDPSSLHRCKGPQQNASLLCCAGSCTTHWRPPPW
jgi:hypothetical protein